MHGKPQNFGTKVYSANRNLNPHGINERLSFNLVIRSVVFHVTKHKSIAQLHISVYKPHTTHNSPICSDKTRNVNFPVSLQWPIRIINPVDKTKLSCNTPHRRNTTVCLETYTLSTAGFSLHADQIVVAMETSNDSKKQGPCG